MEKNIVYGFCFVFVLYYYSFYIVTRTFCLVSILKIEFILEVLKPLILFTIKEETVHTTYFAKKKTTTTTTKMPVLEVLSFVKGTTYMYMSNRTRIK